MISDAQKMCSFFTSGLSCLLKEKRLFEALHVRGGLCSLCDPWTFYNVHCATVLVKTQHGHCLAFYFEIVLYSSAKNAVEALPPVCAHCIRVWPNVRGGSKLALGPSTAFLTCHPCSFDDWLLRRRLLFHTNCTLEVHLSVHLHIPVE